MADYVTSDALVLRKTPWSESSLIIATLTPDAGQVHFMIRGARRSGKKSFPSVDLFRHMRISWRRRADSELFSVHDCECIEPFAAIPTVPAHYRAAGWLCRMILANTILDMPSPDLFTACRSGFSRLNRGVPAPVLPIVLGICFTALREHGQLPDLSGDTRKAAAMEELLAFAVDDGRTVPDGTPERWVALREWTSQYLQAHEFAVPDGLEKILPNAESP